MSRLFSFLLLSFVLLMPMAYAIDKDVDDKVLDPKELKFDDEKDMDKDMSFMHEDHSQGKENNKVDDHDDDHDDDDEKDD